MQFNDINHYLAKRFFLFLAKDKFYPSFNGKIANFRILLCTGAYDIKYPPGPDPKTPVVPPKPEPTCIEGVSAIADAAFDKPAVADIQLKQEQLKDVQEYGFGYWLRFLSRHPVPLLSGKNQAYYFISRLTRNNPYTDVQMGDRVLALWLG